MKLLLPKKSFFIFLIVLFLSIEGFSQTTGDYRSAVTGNWTTLASWEYYNGSAWVTPTTAQGYPGQISSPAKPSTGAVLIQAGHDITMGTSSLSTTSMESLTINGTLNLSAQSSGSVFSINTPLLVVTPGLTPYAQINFDNKVTLNLPANVSVQVSTGGLPTPGDGTCTANIQISIGSTPYAYCTGNGQVTHFTEIMANGGYNILGTVTATSVCNSGTSIISASVKPTPTASTTYNLYSSSTGGVPLSSVTSSVSPYSTSSLITPSITSTTTYYVEAVYSGYTTVRKAVTVTVTNAAAPTGIASQSFCASSNPTVANLLATGTGIIKWYAASSGGAALATNTVLTNDTHYYASQTVSGCESATRFDVTATVNNVPTIATITAPSALCSGGSLGLSAPTVTTNGSTISSQGWQISTTSGSSSYTALSVPYTVALADNGKNIRYTATNGCGTATSNVAVLTVNNVPTIAAITVPSALCSGGSLNPSAPSVTANGSAVTISGWQLETAVGSGTFANQAMAYTVTFADNGKKIRYYATNGCGTTNSNEVTITVNNIPTIAAISTPAALCSGSSLNLTNPTVTANGSVVIASGWQLETTVGGGAYSNLTVPYTVAFVDDGKRIRYYATNACSTVYSNEVIITVNDVPTVPVVGAITQPNCTLDTGSVELSGLPSGSWTLTRLGTSSATITGTGSSTTVSGLVDGGNYTFTVSNGSCTSGSSDEVDIDDISTMTSTWNGSGWVNGVPDNSKRIVFSGDFSSTGDILGCSCKVTSGANVVIEEGHTLKVTNGVQVISGGTLTFENNASLVQINDAAVNLGKINYKRHTAAVKRYDFTYWSSPVAGQTMKALSPGTLGDKYYSYNPTSGWKIEYNGALTMEAGKGYIIRAPQNHPIDVATVDTNPVFIGVPNNGLVSFSIAANQTHLLGNPYPSAIDADKFIAANSTSLEGTLYFWTHNTSPSKDIAGDAIYNYTTNDYITYNKTGGVNDAKGKIAAGQGFFAPASAAGGTIVFNNAMRYTEGQPNYNNSNFLKINSASKTVTTTTATEKDRVWLNLTNTEGAFKQTLVGYITGATNGYDAGYDGLSYDGNQFVDFYSVNNAVNLSIQGRALPFVKQDSVVLGYKSTIKGDFKISIDRTDGALATQNIFLEDKDLKVLHDLTQEAYTFNTEKGVFNNRFVLRYVDKNEAGKIITKEAITDSFSSVSVLNNEIKISSSEGFISKISLYDISGKLLYQKEGIAAHDFVIQNLNLAHQVLLVNVILDNEKSNVTKIMY